MENFYLLNSEEMLNQLKTKLNNDLRKSFFRFLYNCENICVL